MNVPKDKVIHFAAGLVVALVAAIAWGIAACFGVVSTIDAWFAAVLSAGVAGAVKEGADYMDNRTNPGMHGVEPLDFLATLAGSFPVALILRAL